MNSTLGKDNIQSIIIEHGCLDCPLRANSQDGMYCSHPKFSGYEGHIINQDILKNKTIPDRCPLLESHLIKVYSLSLPHTKFKNK